MERTGMPVDFAVKRVAVAALSKSYPRHQMEYWWPSEKGGLPTNANLIQMAKRSMMEGLPNDADSYEVTVMWESSKQMGQQLVRKLSASQHQLAERLGAAMNEMIVEARKK